MSYFHRSPVRIISMALVGLALTAALVACDSDADTPDASPSPSPTATSTAGTPSATPSSTASSTPSASPTATTEPTPEGTPGGNPDGEPTVEDAVDVLDAYFAAINDGDYEAAYALWRNDGEASGQTFAEFTEGYADTESVTWEIGEPGRIDAGAGQRFIEIPVTVEAETSDGETQHFAGHYVLHHTADIEGATPEQRVWRLHSATMEQVD